MSSKIKKILLISIPIVIIVVVISTFIIKKIIDEKKEYEMNNPKIEKIELSYNSSKEIYVGDTIETNIVYTPSDGKHKEYSYSYSELSVLQESDNVLKALSPGNVVICAVLDINSEIRSCVEVTIKSKKEKFINYLVDTLKYKETSKNVYANSLNEYDFNNQTFNVKDDECSYSYQYTVDLITGKCGNYVKYSYVPSTDSFVCVGKNPLYHQYMCSASSQTITQGLFRTIKKSFDSHLGDTYTIEDLK